MEGWGSCSEVGLQYVVRSPAELVILVRTGVFSFTLVHISVTVGCGGLGISGGFGCCGGFGVSGIFACGMFGNFGIWGSSGIFGFWNAGGGGSVNRFPSTSCPSIMLLPRSSTFRGGAWGATPCAAPAPAEPCDPMAGIMGITVASFFK